MSTRLRGKHSSSSRHQTSWMQDENHHSNHDVSGKQYNHVRQHGEKECPAYFRQVCYNYDRCDVESFHSFSPEEVNVFKFINSIKEYRQVEDLPTFLASTRGLATLRYTFSYIHPNQQPATFFFDLIMVFRSSSLLWIGTKRKLMARIISAMWNLRTHESFYHVLRTTHNHKNRVGMDHDRCSLLAWFLIHYYHANPVENKFVTNAIPFLHYKLLQRQEKERNLIEDLCNTFYFIDMNPNVADNSVAMVKEQDFRQSELYPETNQITTHYNRTSQYTGYHGNHDARCAKLLHRHFHLLQEDMIAPLSEELQRLLTHPNKEVILKDYTFSEPVAAELQLQNYGPLSTVIFVKMKSSAILRNKVSRMRAAARKEYCCDPDRTFLSPESVLLFMNGEEVAAIGTVVDKIITFSDDCKYVAVAMRFYGEGLKYVLARLQQSFTGSVFDSANNVGKRLSEYVIQVKASFFGHLPFLDRLQKLVGKEDMSFNDEIVNPQPKVQSSILRYGGITMSASIRRVLQSDEKQYQAAHDALQQKLTIIQGPPGTGKTFVGVKIVQSILQETKHRILVMCYTNHALDSFLESILKERIDNTDQPIIAPSSIVRFGNRQKTSDPILSKCFASLNSNSVPTRETEMSLWEDISKEILGLEVKINRYRHQIGNNDMFDDSRASYQRFVELCTEQNQFSEYIQQLTVPCSCCQSLVRSPLTQRSNKSKTSSKHTVSCSLRQLQTHDYWQMWCNGRSQPYDISVNSHHSFLNHEHDVITAEQFNITNKLVENLWLLNVEQRQEKLRMWYFALMETVTQEMSKLLAERDRLVILMNDISKQSCDQSSNLRIIACTTTFAARNFNFLKDMNVSIAVIEEAAEILEAQLIGTLPTTVKQLVMIGDHQQLKPKLQYFPLSSESRQGIDFDQSLFERLVMKAKYPKVSLAIQHRMRPEISHFVRLLTYPYLIDSEKTKNREDIRGIEGNVIFINHDHFEVNELATGGLGDESSENDSSNKSMVLPLFEAYASTSQSSNHDSGLVKSHVRRRQVYDNFTKSNPHEADMAIAILQYLLQQGYKAEDVTILTPYLGQLQLLQKVIEANGQYISELNDLDRTELKNNAPDVWSTAAVDKDSQDQDKIKIRIATIDNFQGEESKIIIASLVRSNVNREIGFLARPERINVLFSRARDGFILIGNAKTFMECSQTEGRQYWSLLLQEMQVRKCIFEGLPTICLNHRKKQLISTVNDFYALVPHGGCREICGEEIGTCPHKHQCQKYCHPINSYHGRASNVAVTKTDATAPLLCFPSNSQDYHQRMKCMVPTMMKCPRQLHTVVKYCHSRLRERCQAFIEVKCQHGHLFQLKCCIYDVDAHCLDCKEDQRYPVGETTNHQKSKKRYFDDIEVQNFSLVDQAEQNKQEHLEVRTPKNKRHRQDLEANKLLSPLRSAHREVQVLTGKSWKSPNPRHSLTTTTGRDVIDGNSEARVSTNPLLSPFAFREDVRSAMHANSQTPTRLKLLFDDNGDVREEAAVFSSPVLKFTSPSRVANNRSVTITSPTPTLVGKESSSSTAIPFVSKSFEYDRNFVIHSLPSYKSFVTLPLSQALKDKVINYILQTKQANESCREQQLHVTLTSSNTLICEVVSHSIHQIVVESSLVWNKLGEPVRLHSESDLETWFLRYEQPRKGRNQMKQKLERHFIIIDGLKQNISDKMKSDPRLSNHVVIRYEKQSNREPSSFDLNLEQSLLFLVYLLKKELHLMDPSLYFTDEVVYAVAYRIYLDDTVLLSRERFIGEYLPKLITNVQQIRKCESIKREGLSSTFSNDARTVWFSPSKTTNNTSTSSIPGSASHKTSSLLHEISLDQIPRLINKHNNQPLSVEESLKQRLGPMYFLSPTVVKMLPIMAQQLQSMSKFVAEIDLIRFCNFVEMAVAGRLVVFCNSGSISISASIAKVPSKKAIVDFNFKTDIGKQMIELKVDDLNLAMSKFILKKLDPNSQIDDDLTRMQDMTDIAMDKKKTDKSDFAAPSRNSEEKLFHIGYCPPAAHNKYDSRSSRHVANKSHHNSRSSRTSQMIRSRHQIVTARDWMSIDSKFMQKLHQILLDLGIGNRKIEKLLYYSLDNPNILEIVKRFKREGQGVNRYLFREDEVSRYLKEWQYQQARVLETIQQQCGTHSQYEFRSKWRCYICSASANECVICPYSSINWL